MLLVHLNLDILAHIFSQLQPHELLALGLSCRTFKKIVIPTYLYRAISLSHPKVQLKSVQLCCDAITMTNLTVGRSVKSLKANVDGESVIPLSLAMKYLPNLLDVAFKFHYTASDRIHYVLKSYRHPLRNFTLDLCGFDPKIALDLLPKNLGSVARLQSITVLSNAVPYKLTTHTPLGQILLASRETLRELRLDRVKWLIGTASSPPYDKNMPVYVGELVWPHVHTLHLNCVKNGKDDGDGEPGKDAIPDLGAIFPSVLHFEGSKLYTTTENEPFYSRLSSYSGPPQDFAFVVSQTGASLRRAELFHVINPGKLVHLPASLRSLTLQLEWNPNMMEPILMNAPGLTYLSIQLNRNSKNPNKMVRPFSISETLLFRILNLKPIKYQALAAHHVAPSTHPRS